MAERREKNPIFSGPVLLAVTAVASSLILSQTALHSSRPGNKPEHERSSAGDQTVDARLWQDPFEAIHTKVLERSKERREAIKDAAKKRKEGVKESKTQASAAEDNRFSVFEIARQIERQFMQPTHTENRNILVLQVMISGGRYVEDAESRRRSRYAVLSALSVAGYAPWDAEHIGFFEVPWPRGATFETGTDGVLESLTESTKLEDPLPVPFEWFQWNELQPPRPENTNDVPFQRIVVWWLNRDAFEDHSLKRLAQMIEHLRGAITNNQTALNSLKFKLIDPSLHSVLSGPSANPADISITTLPRGQEPEGNVRMTGLLTGVEVYSSWATSADILFDKDTTTTHRETIAANLKTNWGMTFYNVTCTDDQLASKLVSELQLRGVNLTDNKCSVALISEWDTFYGRALPLTFAAEIKRRAENKTFNAALLSLETNKDIWPSNISRFTYMRGIDGLLPGEAPPKADPGKEKTKAKEIEEMERPVGQSQLDYVPRLAQELKEREREGGGVEHDHKPLRAIGVLGSDVYDKLLLLQSLHKIYPGVIFFTTDLDARLLHPAELGWSRNLIVASSFDLELGEKLQKDIPPFRDTYQTGQFLACLAALGKVETDLLTNIAPRIFEVGRHGAYTLNIVPTINTNELRLYSTRPAAFTRDVSLVWRILTILLAFLLIGSFSLSHKAIQLLRPTGELGRKRRRLYMRRCLRAAPVILGVGVGLWMLIYYEHYKDENGEPFSLYDGISLWPSEIIRLAAAGLSLIFLFMAESALKKSNRRLTAEFGLPIFIDSTELSTFRPPAETGQQPKGMLKRWLGHVQYAWKKWLSVNICCWEWKESKVRASSLWLQYGWMGTRRNRLWRILPAVALYVFLGGCLVKIFGEPFRPFRGPASGWVDLFVIVISSIALIILIFFVVDTALLCQQFIKNLSEKQTEWPPALLHRHTEARKMAPEHLGEWLDIQLIAKRTKVVGNFIYYPFIVLFLMIVARTTYFDHFDWPLSLILIFGINSAFAFYCAFALRQATEKARHDELRQLEERLVKARGADDEQSAATIELTIEQIKSVSEGAFAPWSEQPFIRAILVPFGGTGIMGLVQYLLSG